MNRLYLCSAMLAVVGVAPAQQIATHYQAELIARGVDYLGMDDIGNMLYWQNEVKYRRIDGSTHNFPSVPGTSSFCYDGSLNGNGEVLLVVRQASGGDAYLRSFDMVSQTYSDPYLLPFNVDLTGTVYYSNDRRYVLYGEDTGVSYDPIYGDSPTHSDYIYAPTGQQGIAMLGENGWMLTKGQTSGSDSNLFRNGQWIRKIPKESSLGFGCAPNSRGEFGFSVLTAQGTQFYSSLHIRDAGNNTIFTVPNGDNVDRSTFYTDSEVLGGYSSPNNLVIAKRAFLWSPTTGRVDLTSITSGLNSGDIVHYLYKMNANGQMAATVRSANGSYGVYRLDPVPEPASVLALGVGLAALVKRRRAKS